jgi:hypothetical protein
MTTQERNAMINGVMLTPAAYLKADEARMFSAIGTKLRQGKTPSDSELLKVAKFVPMGVTSLTSLPVDDMLTIIKVLDGLK